MNERHPLAIAVTGVTKSFDAGKIPALNGCNLAVEEREFVAIMGPSGCGKSTLLHLIAALDLPDAGEIRIRDHLITTGHNLNHVRARDIGLVFQLHNLLPSLTASENVQLPMFESERSRGERSSYASELLSLVGLEGKDHHRPTELSGGERQRVAVARALANDPPILLADEPTGSLDSVAGQRILDLIERLRQERGLTIVMVTHDPNVAARADRIVRMLDGRVVDDGRASAKQSQQTATA